MKTIKYITFLLICACLTLVSCQDNDADISTSGGAGVRVTFDTPGFTQVGTRAINDDSGIRNITVLQYINGSLQADNIIKVTSGIFSDPVLLEGLKDMDVAGYDSNGALIDANVLVFLANVPTATGSSDFPATYDQFDTYKIKMNSAANLHGLTNIPMIGYYYDGIISGLSNHINVTLARSLAKIDFRLKMDYFKAEEKGESEKPSMLAVKRIELRNVPTEITFFSKNRPGLPMNGKAGEWPLGSQIPYPTTGGAVSDGSADAVDFVTLGRSENLASNVLTNFLAYIPENARGSYDDKIKGNSEKRPENLSEDERVGLTYIFVEIEYTTSSGSDKTAEYKIYLGGDARGDMNILSNTQYTITTYIYGDNDEDTRITVKPDGNDYIVADKDGYSIQKSANCYIINHKTKDLPKFTIPLAHARVGWKFLAGEGIAGLADYEKLMNSGDWEIVTLWKTWQGGSVKGGIAAGLTDKVVASGVSLNNYYAILDFPADIDQIIDDGNNCVIALRDETTQEIWWTWHLWFTDYNPDAEDAQDRNGQIHKYFSTAFSNTYGQSSMMDRNLGATITKISHNYDYTNLPDDLKALSSDIAAETAAKWYGLMYQWGRKDPFTSSKIGVDPMTEENGNVILIYDSDNVRLFGDNSEIDGFTKWSNAAETDYNRLADAIHNPMTYYHSGGVSNDWTMKNDNLWQIGQKMPFDPCPPGWRVPAGGTTATNNPWAGFFNKNAGSTTGGNNGQNSVDIAGEGVFEWYDNTGERYPTPNAIGPRAGRLYLGNNGTDPAWYPASGRRESSSGLFGGTGANGYYWSSAVSGANGHHLHFNSTGVYPSNSYERARGYGVRCVQN